MARTVRSLSAVRPLDRPKRPSRAGHLVAAPAAHAPGRAAARPASTPAVAG
ncbi:hypothetical protein RMN57_04865 [Kitasatospora sp. CM 4170]|uniref:Uncharacterized protein n=1 Tax=Kitasatospora aburaviensis TaxID=67265 RepID=A0ABW1ETC7_9ACTN|nr:hypothetical protein [Kitasatospora sp. CM 4170]WNM44091.1 hypothetical protein RMN57_04865 [Kitasatospora sp. CM 4170]